jgi:hypothetical protein
MANGKQNNRGNDIFLQKQERFKGTVQKISREKYSFVLNNIKKK